MVLSSKKNKYAPTLQAIEPSFHHYTFATCVAWSLQEPYWLARTQTQYCTPTD
ncbi:MAG: hypothetical protein NT106_14745 [Candidatus Sumerlaeota bacterium]|nr:hypothetical protein [Candidatus Sumerlaeota bacterium]